MGLAKTLSFMEKQKGSSPTTTPGASPSMINVENFTFQAIFGYCITLHLFFNHKIIAVIVEILAYWTA